MKRGGSAYILEDRDTCPPGAICFLEEEWAYTKKLALSLKHDPEAHKNFWETCLERKLSIPGYVIFMDFPTKAPDADKAAGLRICNQILEKLKGHSHVGKEEGE